MRYRRAGVKGLAGKGLRVRNPCKINTSKGGDTTGTHRHPPTGAGTGVGAEAGRTAGPGPPPSAGLFAKDADY